MKQKDLEKATDKYLEFWYDRDEEQKHVARLAFRAGVVWLLRELMNKPFDEVAKSTTTLYEDMRR